jgi:transposase
VLLRADGVPISHIAQQVGIRRRHAEKWVKRFIAQRIDGLNDKPGRGRKPFFPSGDRNACGEAGVRAA